MKGSINKILEIYAKLFAFANGSQILSCPLYLYYLGKITPVPATIKVLLFIITGIWESGPQDNCGIT